ncbi:MAG TPA: efflux RND transporter periplasmic adaptor subunit, partial [Terriglobales bacterium]|nr:efflux RND transporter periplasmic adaptor subunit [Terriglobales bacterium]
ARTAIPDAIESVGSVHAAESAQLSAQMMGNIVAVNVHEGDRVRRGQVLAVIDASQPQAALERAQAGVSAAEHEAAAAESDFGLAESTLRRYEDLYSKKSVSPQEFDEIKARAQGASARREMARSGQAQAKAALAQARTAFEYTRVRAPFDGVVTERKVDPGALAAPGMPLLTVEGSGRYRLEANVDETSLRDVRMGESVRVAIDALGGDQSPLEGKVVQIVPAAEVASRSFVVKVELPTTANLHSGLFGRAYFPRGTRESLLVPESAVIERGQLQGVYVLGQDNIANLRYVTLGKHAADRQVEVLSGLMPGETLVRDPGQRDLAGKRIASTGERQ